MKARINNTTFAGTASGFSLEFTLMKMGAGMTIPPQNWFCESCN
jgi:hypothetical protein